MIRWAGGALHRGTPWNAVRETPKRSPDVEWRFVVTDHGHPIGAGTTRRRPTTAQRRIIEPIYPRCIFLGCRTPAISCDIDHTTPYADTGVTRIDDLGPLCEHDCGWGYGHTPDGIEWTSPLRIRYLNRRPTPCPWIRAWDVGRETRPVAKPPSAKRSEHQAAERSEQAAAR